MTGREIITEFILQKIQQGDLVEILTTNSPKPYLGRINDKDVFPALPVKLIVDNVIHNANHNQIEKIRLTLIDEEDESIEIHNLLSLTHMPFPRQVEIHVSEIISITKKEG